MTDIPATVMWEATGGGLSVTPIEKIGRFCSFFRTCEQPFLTARVKGGRRHKGHYDKKKNQVVTHTRIFQLGVYWAL